MEAESDPVMINLDGDYEVFREKDLRSISTEFKELLIPTGTLSEQGLWLYEGYARGKVKAYRVIHSLGVFIEIACFLLGQILGKQKRGYHQDIPFCVDPIFNTTLWVFVIVLEIAFLHTIFRHTALSITLVADKLKSTYFIVYAAISTFFLTTNVFEGTASYIITDIVACLIFSMILYTYLLIKYQDDGRYVVSVLDYLGVYIHFSVILAWSLMVICEYFFRTLALFADSNSKDDKLLGWDNQSWTVLVMVLNFMVATLWLHKYKDIYFSIVLSFTFFGIFSMQKRETCIDDKDSCSVMVQAAALCLASILVIFVLLTIWFHRKLVLYNIRRKDKEKIIAEHEEIKW